MFTSRMELRQEVARRRGGFTLIEVLVVVAIIALLISILLPSLRQARDVSKMVVCQSHQKEIGHAMSMYFADFKDSLPGPLHPLFLKNPNAMGGAGFNKFIIDGYVNTRLRKYFGEGQFGKGGMTSQVGTCPSHPTPDKDYGIIAFNYALNSSAITAPNYYFGFTHGGVADWDQWKNDYGNKSPKWWPKKLSRVLSGNVNGANEWMLADAFRRPLPKGTPWPVQDEVGYQIFPAPDAPNSTQQNSEWGSLSPSVQVQTSEAASGRNSPHAPFHPGQGGFKQVRMAGGTRTVFYGKVNTLYFDMHVEAQNGWKGTSVPSFVERYKKRLD